MSVDLKPASASASGGDERPNDDYMFLTLKVQRVREVQEKRFLIAVFPCAFVSARSSLHVVPLLLL